MKKQLLLLVMILLPMVAMADESGLCGKYVSWTYTKSTHTLRVYGEGNMYDYYTDKSDESSTIYMTEFTPWEKYKGDIQKIIIDDGVSYIGGYAFHNIKNLKSVEIDDCVRIIGKGAFTGCNSLISICIGKGITYIDLMAFGFCSSLGDVYIYAEAVPTNISYFDNSQNITLHVPASSVEDYRASKSWKNFGNIVALTDEDPKPTGIDKIVASDVNKNEVYFDLNCKRIQSPRKGLNIVKMSDGTTKKVIVK